MRKMIVVLLIAFAAITGIVGAGNYVGNAKGPDDPRADMIGVNQSVVLNLSGMKSLDIWNQAFGRTGIAVIELSGTDPSVFLTPAYKKEGVGDGGSYGAWAPGI